MRIPIGFLLRGLPLALAWTLLMLPARAQQGSFEINGTVTSGGAGLSGIPIVLGGDAADTTTTGQNGQYSFSDLPAGTYTVTPTHAAYVFAPEHLTMTFPGTGTTTPVFEATPAMPTRAAAAERLPESVGLEQNYPNPFRQETVIRYRLSAPGLVRLDVVDVLGRTVAVLADGLQPAGTHTARLDAHRLPPGLYLCRLRAAATRQVRPMIRAK